MERSEKFEQLPKALVAAQKLIGGAAKGAVNPFFRSKYADLGAVMEACKEALNSNGVAVLQPVGRDVNGQYVETILLHESGEWMSDKMTIRFPDRMVSPDTKKSETFTPYLAPDPQAQGSAITYARRYALQSLLFIPAEDDDGNKASARATPTPAPAPQAKPAPAPAAPAAKPNDEGKVFGEKLAEVAAVAKDALQEVLESEAVAGEEGLAIIGVKTSTTKDGTVWYEITDSKKVRRLTTNETIGKKALLLNNTGTLVLFKDHKTGKGNLMVDEMKELF